MTEFIDRLDRKRRIEFERSYKEGFIVMKMYNDKSTYGDCIEIPEEAFKEIVNNGLKVING